MTASMLLNGPPFKDAHIEVRRVETEADWELIQHLRNVVYVQAEHRIGGTSDFVNSFDRYNDESVWFVAVGSSGQALGTAKVIRDSEKGLPYESVMGRQEKGPEDRVVEIGHLITLASESTRRVVLELLREAFAYCHNVLQATHVVGDVFLDKTRGDAFYRRVGFKPIHGPYQDSRFLDAPLSMIVMLRVADVIPLMRRARGSRKELFRFLTGGCHDPEMLNAAAPELAPSHPAHSAGH
jgi:hypothetical protein